MPHCCSPRRWHDHYEGGEHDHHDEDEDDREHDGNGDSKIRDEIDGDVDGDINTNVDIRLSVSTKTTVNGMEISAPKANPHRAKLPLFSRKGWKRVRSGDLVENLNETCDPQSADVEGYIAMEHRP